jgi:hypothetical protein
MQPNFTSDRRRPRNKERRETVDDSDLMGMLDRLLEELKTMSADSFMEEFQRVLDAMTEEELEEMMDRCSDIIEGVEKRLEGDMPFSA